MIPATEEDVVAAVAEDADFFVGEGGALVHDNTLPDVRLAPFDAPPALAAVAAE